MSDLYCKLFVQAPMTRDELVDWLARSVGGRVRRRTIAAQTMELDVSSNDEFDAQRADLNGGFLYFPFIVDVTPADHAGHETYVAAVDAVVRSMRGAGMRVAVACDFEDELASDVTWEPNAPHRGRG